MTSTSHLELPLLAPSQAQKHVTVNEALMRLDAMTQLVLVSRNVGAPPASVDDGMAYAVPASPAGAWSDQSGRIAISANGGWVFLTPRRGWRAWIADEHMLAIHDGLAWRGGAVALSPSGAGTFLRVTEFDHTLGAGPASVTAGAIPAHSMVLAVTARVTQAITGSLATWSLGNAGAPDRFGSGMGKAVGAFARGLLGAPMSFYAAEPLVLTAAGGNFTGGSVRLAIHYFEASLPGG